ncbi:MAG: hypothetical protein ACK4YQ_15305 [Phenylobacterium sp.]|uniref:hypothetical protein n=1 Tax=Phenylobacterium sp. TaxID=1871053 RepID=UPI00391C2177
MAIRPNDRAIGLDAAGDERARLNGRRCGTVVAFPTTRSAPRPIPKLELLSALFGALSLAGGEASVEALVTMISAALPDRSPASVRSEVSELLAYYSAPKGKGPAGVCIFDDLGGGRYGLSAGVREYLL